MAFTAQDILSRAQSNVGDLAMNRVQRKEWISAFNDITVKVAEHTEIWISRFNTIPNPVASLWELNNNYSINSVVKFNNEYYICVQAHLSTNSNKPPSTVWSKIEQWDANSTYSKDDIVRDGNPVKFYRALTDITSPGVSVSDSNYWTEIFSASTGISVVTLPYSFNDNTLAPFRILRVARKGESSWTELEEFSQQAIGTETGGNYAFRINKSIIGNKGYSTNFTDITGQTTDAITFTFSEAFSSGEELVIDYISGRPFQLTLWQGNGTTPDPVVPDFLCEVFEKGITAKIMERLFLSGDDSMGNRYQMTQGLFNKYLRDAVGYAKMLRNTKQSIRIQPLNFLDENYRGM